MNTREAKLKMIEPIVEKGLEKFWKKYGRTLFVKARHVDLTVQPRMIVGSDVNPEVMRRLIEAYLAKMTPNQLVNGEIEFTGESLLIKNKKGQLLVEVTSRKIIDGMRNVITHRIGQLLAQTERNPKETYLPAKEDGRYCFGEIKDAVKLFLAAQGKEVTGSYLIDALLLLDQKEPSNITFSLN